MLVNYDELVTNYKTNLETKLRGFAGGPGCLETWTYDDDDTRSINNIVDLAKEDKHEVVEIKVRPELLEKMPTKLPFEVSPGGVTFKTNHAMAIEIAINRLAKDLGIKSTLRVVGLRKTILTLDYEETPGEKSVHLYLMRLEKMLNDEQGTRFFFQTLNLDDKNKRTTRG